MELGILATALGLTALFGAVGRALFRILFRSENSPFRKGHRFLVVRVDGETISINIEAIDREDSRKLERAVRAVSNVQHAA